MKKIFFISLLTAGLLFHAACTDEVTYDQEQYKSVVHLKESGVVNIDFYNIGQDVSFETCITKGGTDPSVAGDVSLVEFTEEELETYNQGYGSDFKLLPEGYYTMPDKVSFEANQEATNIKIVLKANIGELDDDISYILPIRLESENHNVYSFKNSLLLHPKVITPTVSLDAIGVQTITMYDYPTAAEEMIYETGLTLDFFNEWEFNVKLVNDWNKLDELVRAYNEANSTDYETLPANNYTMPSTIVFGSDESSKLLSVQLRKDKLDGTKEYLLPVVLNEIEGVPFDISDQTLYIRLRLTKELPRLVFDKELASTNNTSPWTTSEGASAAFDGNVSTYWQNQWQAWEEYIEPVNDPIYGFYLDVDLASTNIKLNTLLNFIVKVRGWYRTTLPYTVRLYGGTSKDDLQPISEELPIRLVEKPEKQTVFENPTAMDISDKSGITYLRFAILEAINKDANKIVDLRQKEINGTWNWQSVCITELEYYGL